MTKQAEPAAVTVSWGRDYRTSLHNRYEYCVFEGESIVLREGSYSSSAAAKRAGIRAAQAFAERATEAA